MPRNVTKKPKASPLEYDCGVRSGQRVRLKQPLVMKDGVMAHSVGEIWSVMPGIDLRPRRFVLLHKPDGCPHIWSGETFWDWFELVS